ncbi:MAG TPA: HisA/HisF-related TIM barrel protein [Patescibacteria group bacterium]|nr:HisA/HisF-related TIM barrel protein [Patescibacteria group bacterium]
MLLVIPAIELRDGVCLRCIQGEPGMEQLYSALKTHPEELVKLWRRENSKTIHITDVNAIETHDLETNVEMIAQIVRSVDIPVQLFSACATIDECEFWLENGIYRIILSVLPFKNGEKVTKLIQKYTPSRVVMGIRANNGNISGHPAFPEMKVDDCVIFARSLGFKRIVYTDVSWEGKLSGPDISVLKSIAENTGLRVTAAGGVASPEHLWALQALEPFGVDSVVIGRALYENRFPCQKIWRLAEAELERGIIETIM